MAATPLRERTRREIQQQAVELFAHKGYESTSLQDIATAAGCSKATVLYHFNGKPAVLASVLEPSAVALAALVAEAAAKSPEAAQEHAISGFVDLAVRFRGLVSVLHHALPDLICTAEFSGLVVAGEQLTELLAGSAGARELAMARFAVNGLLAECRDSDDRTDDDLRDVCDTALRRLLRAPLTPTTEPANGTSP